MAFSIGVISLRLPSLRLGRRQTGPVSSPAIRLLCRAWAAAWRARIVLLAADGEPLDRIARQVSVDRNVVRQWVDRYRVGGLGALQDRPRPGRPRTFSP